MLSIKIHNVRVKFGNDIPIQSERGDEGPQTNFTGGVDIGHMGNQEIRSPDFHFVALIDEPENVRTRIYWNL
jgi:hypothetical protein